MIFKALSLTFISVFSHLLIQQHESEKYNSIQSASIYVTDSHQHKFNWSASPMQLQKAFGTIKASKEPDEMLGGTAYTYKYNGLEISFNESNCESIIATKPTYKILLDKVPFSVGDHIEKVKSAFPLSFQHRTLNTDHSAWIYVGIKSNNQVVDSNVAITYNKAGVITEILIQNNNS